MKSINSLTLSKTSHLERFGLPHRAETCAQKAYRGGKSGNGHESHGDDGQAERIQRRLWVLLNMETPERKPASSTAKRPRVRQSAATSLQRERGLDQGFWIP